MVIWTLLGVLMSVIAGLTGYIVWRDHRRSSVGKGAGGRRTMETADRFAAERHSIQGLRRQQEDAGWP